MWNLRKIAGLNSWFLGVYKNNSIFLAKMLDKLNLLL